MYRIFLIGYMGCGKTTIGKKLAEKLGYGFVDIDACIEEKQFKSISQIFAELGEDKFRQLEKQMLHEVAQFEDVVISTGGGAPCFFDNMSFMNNQGLSVYIKLSTEELTARLAASKANKRPLIAHLKGEELQQFVAEGLAKRAPFYSQATLSVSGTDDEMIQQICEYMASV